MWSRVVEIMLGCWLAISPFVFRHAPEETAFWVNDFATSAAIIGLALVSWYRPLRHAHVGIVAVGIWLILFAYLHFGEPAPPALQNNALVGLLLVMFAVIPNRASEPPDSWAKFERDSSETMAA